MLSQSATLLGLTRNKNIVSPKMASNLMFVNDILNDNETIQDTALMDVLHIRNEIVNNAIKICYKKYLEKQSIKFFVQCSYEAFMRILRLRFYPHDCRIEFYDQNSKLGPDKHPLPSAPDTWAANTIQFYDPSFREYDEDIASTDEFVDDTTQTITTASRIVDVEHSLVLTVSNLSVKDSATSVSEDSTSFELAAEEQNVPNPSEVSLEEVETDKMIPSKTTSYFTSVATSLAKRDGVPLVLSEIFGHKGNMKKQKSIKIKAPHVCNDSQHPKNIQLEDLPPVRAPTTFKYNVFAEEEKKKVNSKKNSGIN